MNTQISYRNIFAYAFKMLITEQKQNFFHRWTLMNLDAVQSCQQLETEMNTLLKQQTVSFDYDKLGHEIGSSP